MTSPVAADHPRRAAARRPAPARRGRRHHARRRPRQHGARCVRWGAASVVLLGADLADAARRAPPAPARPGARRRARTRRATGSSAARWPPVPPTSSSCRQADAWLVELLTDAADGGARRARTVGVVGGSGGVGATTFACALALTAPPRTGRPSSSTSTRSGPGSTGSSASTRRSTRRGEPAGTRWSARTAGSAPGRCAPRCRPRTAWRCSPGRRGRRCRSTPRRSARCSRPPSAATTLVVVDLPRYRSTTSAPRSSRGATGCCWWPSRRSPGSRPPARSRPSLRPLNEDAGRGRARRPGRRSRPSTSPTSWSCRCSPRCRTQRRLAEHVDLGPRAGARAPLAAGPGRPGRPRRWPRRPRPGRSRELRQRPGRRCPPDVLDGVREQLARSGAAAHPRRGRPRAARPGPAGRGRHRAGRPRPAPPGRPRRRARSSRCSGCRASPTCWSTAPTRSTSTAARGWS